MTAGFLSAVRLVQGRVPRIADPDLRETMERALRDLADKADRHSVMETKILNDTNLSESGKATRLLELTNQTRNELKGLLEKTVDADEASTRLQALLFAVPDPPKGDNELLQYLRESELRTWLRSVPQTERMNYYLSAVARGDIETVRAIRLAPGVPLIPQDFRERVDREHIEATKPKESLRLQSLNEVREHLHALVDHAEQWLRSDVPTPPIKKAPDLVGSR